MQESRIEKIKSHDFDATKIPQTGLEFDESRFDAVSFIVKIFQGLIDEGRGTVNRERSLSRNKEEEELFFSKVSFLFFPRDNHFSIVT